MGNRPILIKELLEKTLEAQKAQAAPSIYKEDIVRAWQSAVGSKAAKHAQPAALKKGVLFVNVDSPVWIYQLNIKKAKIEQALKKALKQEAPVTIRLRAGES